ncbi:uncharacterized protein [Asterias amurensis]|uniref:uncharacterized protein n=1 Tax=Asterias amurensis TaxID=7602 RepID=UPI003AB8C73C
MAVATLRCVYVCFVTTILMSLPTLPVLAGRKSLHRQRGARPIRHCPDDMFDDQIRRPQNDTGALNCRPCSLCMAGFGVQRLCTWTEDTQCIPCRDGHYSESSDMFGDCLMCRQCGMNQGVRRPCTRTSNTVCSQRCARGFFFSPYDRDCLPCSPCHQPGDRESGIVAVACKAAGMPRDMQCWPTHAHGNQAPDSQPDLQSTGGDHDTTDLEIPGPADDENRPISTTSKTDDHPPSPRPSTGPDKETSQLVTFILISLLIVVGLCILLAVAVLVCLGRLVKLTNSATPRPKKKNGYHCLSKRTANLLVGSTAHV